MAKNANPITPLDGAYGAVHAPASQPEALAAVREAYHLGVKCKVRRVTVRYPHPIVDPAVFQELEAGGAQLFPLRAAERIDALYYVELPRRVYLADNPAGVLF